MYYGTNASSVLGYYTLSGGSGANTTLSNLTSPTSINQNLIPLSSGVKSLGGPSNAWNTTYTQFVQSVGGSLTVSTINESGSTSSNQINIATGTTVNGNSGDIIIETGAVSGTGVQGIIQFEAPTINLNGAVTIGSSAVQHNINTTVATNASNTLTLTNAPSAISGNPSGYIQITINGSTHYLPYW
jgi:hypothetical protein